MIEPYMINVGGHLFTTLKSILERSPFLNAMLSNQWAGSTLFQLEVLTTWIRNEESIKTILITSSIDVIPLSECGDGKSHLGNTEQEFEPGAVSTAFRSGKSTTYCKRLFLRKSRLRPPEIL
ncbi:hypothetical protein COCCADRAFT_41962 [Bipolaris zeicola 26-R-13]|uniref:Uncharacterized protein n=1 Tax=Cochliobolus carbonum (strain 26-R-13) TaxID=930089 RepID=W6XPT6_COCC2|nr:uncharacterized protein COCCADRAFT_41962 [Bipolaris zeicola 26-R-13]EUC27255.1 hypothetical protein COCCADRAFT_41962 [Bipolaris zeicola 26-R-13]